MCSNGLLSQLVTLIRTHQPQGIGLMDVSKEFYMMFGNRLNPNEYNRNNLHELVEELSLYCGHSLILAKPNELDFKSERVFLDESLYDNWIKKFKIMKNVEALESLVSPMFPEDVPFQHRKDHLIPLTSVPEDETFSQPIKAFKVKVVNIESPSLMFVRLLRYKHIYSDLRQMMRFYDGNDLQTDPYILPKELAVVSYVCAARNPRDWGNWHRGVIVETNGERITLYAIDFGNIIVEERKELRLLKDTLFEAPPQVIKISLEGISPLSDEQFDGLNCDRFWSEESVLYLKTLVNKYKNSIECIFLQRLSPNYYSVFLQSYFDVVIRSEEIMNPFVFYFHESLVRKGLADLYSRDSEPKHYYFTAFSSNGVSEAIEEPLLAIKYEPEYECESPAVRPQELKEEVKSEELSDDEQNQESGANGATSRQNSEEINYKRLFFTNDKSPEVALFKYFPKSSDSPLTEHKYFNEDMVRMSFPCYERIGKEFKYFIKEKSKSMPEFPQFMYSYYRPQSKNSSVKPKYYSESDNWDDSKLTFKYYTSDESSSSDYTYYSEDDSGYVESKCWRSTDQI